MKRENNHNKYLTLRGQFPFFEYQSYSFHINNQNLEAEFVFNLSDKYLFKPSIKIPLKEFYAFNNIEKEKLKTFVFHIGMVELISYWKAACPTKLIIRPFLLNEVQVNWWKKLYYNGLGEFFYLNSIETNLQDFMEISSQGEPLRTVSIEFNKEGIIVPIGGGKDSVVTLELLKSGGENVTPMTLNPREASIRSIESAGYTIENSIVVERKIAPLLLELNREGFLNGHTPFSALLAFVNILTATLSGIRYIALSNESSANESTVPGSDINHQYSKSFEFEEDFNWYVKHFINADIRYFSFLRPINELQIARLFSNYPHHFDGFRSCNVGSKMDNWCGECPKCLFTFIILSPFMNQHKLTSIFGKDLFDDNTLKPIFNELTGKSEVKPFECVGTPDEIKAALRFTLKNSDRSKIPALLLDFQNSGTPDNIDSNFKALLLQFDEKHFIPNHLTPLLKDAIR